MKRILFFTVILILVSSQAFAIGGHGMRRGVIMGWCTFNTLTNSLLNSRDLTSWGEVGTNVAAYNAVGLIGIAKTATLITDDQAGGAEGVYQNIAIANDSNTHTAIFYVKKDSDESRFPEFQLNLVGGATQNIGLQINTKNGDSTIRYSGGTVNSEVSDIGGWWKIILSVKNNNSGNTTARIFAYASYATEIGANEITATGTLIIGNIELYINKTISDIRRLCPKYTP